jgi:N-acetylmuramoyl-L-alanine amidase
MRKISYIVVHCTATGQNATIQALKNGWKALGWKNVGYHKVVHPNGDHTVLAPDSKVTNGVAGHNANSLHISYIGGIDAKGKAVDNRTEAQKKTLIIELDAWKKLYPNATIVGHRDFSPDKDKDGVIEYFEFIKFCPCFDAIPEYANL